MKSKLSRFFALTILIIYSAIATAQSNPYSLTKTCASQGAWTQRALSQTESIITAINQLRSIDACKGLELEKLRDAAVEQMGTLRPEAGAEPYANRMESIPGRISALQSYYNSGDDDSLKPDVMKALMKETMNGAAVAVEAVSQKGLFTALPYVAARSNATFSKAADLLEKITATLPKMDRCLIGQADQGGAFIASIIDLTASFAASGDGVHGRLGDSIKNVIKLMQQWKFTGALRQLDQTHLRTSMACIIESTAESYCSVQDAHHLLDKGAAEYKPVFKMDPDKEDISLQHPLAGYYVLIQHLPTIARWIQKVQYGVEPQWAEDAQFKISSFTNVTNLQTSIWSIKGKFNSDLKIYYKASSQDDKKLALMMALTNVVTALGGGDPMVDPSQNSPNGINFFTLSTASGYIPFFLIGRKSTPLEVSQNQAGGIQMMHWDEYMRGNGTFERVPEFNAPDALIKTINTQLDIILNRAREKASDFYRERIIVNQPNLAVESLVSQAYSPHKSFKFINRYLANLEARLIDKHFAGVDEDFAKIIPALRDTQKRLRVILEAYEGLEKLYDFDPQTNADSKIVEDAYKKVIQTVYDQLDVLWQRDSYLTGSLNNFIYADYVFRIKTGMDLGGYERDLLMTSKSDLLNMLTMIHSVNPSTQTLDLQTANTANLENLASLHVFDDTLVTSIEYYNEIIAKHPTGDWEMTRLQTKRMWEDTFINGQSQHENPVTSWWSNAGGILGRLFMRHSLKPDLYPLRVSSIPNYHPTQDTSFDDIKGFRNQLCLLSLAIGNVDDNPRIKQLCKGAVLVANYGSTSHRFALNTSYDDLVNSPRDGDFQERTVCAFRNFNRKNLVFWLTQNLTNTAE
jgi:hypothetical protein